MATERLTGRLLVATPQIDEGIFHRAVVLVLQHDSNGAQGVVLNKALEAPVDAVLPGWGDVASDPGSLYQGGPVQVDSALGLVTLRAYVPSAVQPLFPGVGLVDLDAQPSVVAPDIAGLRVFVGYAGWSPGQLDTEIRTGSWYAVDASVGDVISADPTDLWRKVLARQRGSLAWVALLPEDPSIN